METIKIHDVFRKRALVTRESAHALKIPVMHAVKTDGQEIGLDFAGVDAVTPSFIDEVLLVVEDEVRQQSAELTALRFINLPPGPSAAFAAIARAHRVDLKEQTASGEWLITGDFLAM